MAQLLFGVGDQLEGQLQVLLEFFMRRHVVARYAKHDRAGFHKIFVVVTELHGFRGAAGSVVFGVKVQNNVLTGKGLRCELHTAGCKRFKVREGFVESWRHEVFCAVGTHWARNRRL